MENNMKITKISSTELPIKQSAKAPWWNTVKNTEK